MSVGACCMNCVNVFQSVCEAEHDMYTGMSRNGCASRVFFAIVIVIVIDVVVVVVVIAIVADIEYGAFADVVFAPVGVFVHVVVVVDVFVVFVVVQWFLHLDVIVLVGLLVL